MKHRILSAVLVLLVIFTCSCSEKTPPAIKLKSESVTSAVFKKTAYSDTDPEARSYTAKTVTSREDIDRLISWVQSLSLEKQSAIEIPVEQVSFVIELNGKVAHKLIFMNEYVILDTTAYTYKNASQKSQVSEKYNLLNYEETKAELDLM